MITYILSALIVLICVGAGFLPAILIKYDVTKKYASKKFIVAMLLLITTALLTYTGKMNGADASIIFSLIGSGYALVNLSDKQNGTKVYDEVGFQSRKFIIVIGIIAASTVLGSIGALTSMQLALAYGISGSAYGLVAAKEKQIKKQQ